MSELEFKVGDRVVYPAHGVGCITDEEVQTVGGMELKVFVVSFDKEKMILRVPKSRAEKELRHLISDAEKKKLFSTLKGKAKKSRGMWSRRAQEYETKINSGNIIALAEVVRDLHKNVEDPDRSFSERNIYELAMSRLCSEFAAIENIDKDEALKNLTTVLDNKKEKVLQEEAA